MLETLRIQNYALIDRIEVDFQPGFNVLTGETGAGKSIVVGALNLVLGARASSEVVRNGADRASIDAIFLIGTPSRRLHALLDEYGIPLEEGRLLLSRVIGADGRSRAYAGGVLSPISVLAAIGDELVDLHGQHEHQSLLKADRQLDLLDGFGGTEHAASDLASQVARLRTLEREISAMEGNERERTRQYEFLQFEVNEIDQAGFTPGEEEELKARLNLINNAETIFNLAGHAYAALYETEDGSAIDALDAAARDLDALAAIDSRFQPLAAQLAEARGEVEAIAEELRGHADRIEFDPDELEQLNARLALLSALKRKYGSSIDEMLAYRNRAAAEIDAYEQRDERLAALQQEHERLVSSATDAAQTLSKKRQSASKCLDKEVQAAMQDLGMKGARFETAFETIPLSANGVDRISFLLSANAGEKPKPLRQVASGGEISRIMLALKAVFAEADQIPALIFDEIDAGVGGTVARKVAAKLAGLAKTHQVICITHIAQIAAMACAHYRVEKQESKNRTLTQVLPIDADERVQELARLLDGSLSETSIGHARVLLEENTTTGPRK